MNTKLYLIILCAISFSFIELNGAHPITNPDFFKPTQLDNKTSNNHNNHIIQIYPAEIDSITYINSNFFETPVDTVPSYSNNDKESCVIPLSPGELPILSDTPIILDCWAPWCGPCMAFKPIFHNVAKKFDKTSLIFMSANIDECTNLPTVYNFSAIPTIIILKKGESPIINTGLLSETELIQFIETNITTISSIPTISQSKSFKKNINPIIRRLNPAEKDAIITPASVAYNFVMACLQHNRKKMHSLSTGDLKLSISNFYPSVIKLFTNNPKLNIFDWNSCPINYEITPLVVEDVFYDNTNIKSHKIIHIDCIPSQEIDNTRFHNVTRSSINIRILVNNNSGHWLVESFD